MLFSGRVDSPLMFSNPIYRQQKAQLLVELVSWIAWEEIILSVIGVNNLEFNKRWHHGDVFVSL